VLRRPSCRPGQQVNKKFQMERNGDFKAFESAYKTLTEKLQPMVYELGFLKA
jgi:hypothetical protein